MFEGVHLTLMMGMVATEPVPRTVAEALTKVQVVSSTDQRSGFQLTFAVGKGSPLMLERLPEFFFDPPRRVILMVTLNGETSVLMDGVITKQDLAQSNEPGQSTLTITGVDVTQMMDLIDFSWMAWPAMPREVRVLLMLEKYMMYGIVPEIVPSLLTLVDSPLDLIPKQKGTDLQYIRRLAEEVGYVFYVEPGPAAHVNQAYWGPEIKVGIPQPALSVNMDAASNVESISFAFDGIQKAQYVLFIQEQNTGLTIPVPIPDVTPLNPPLGPKLIPPLQLKFLDRSLDKDTDSDGMAKLGPLAAAMRGLATASKGADVVTAQGTLDVARYGRLLKARRLVGVRGAGPTYDGHYFVKSVTHTISRGSYKQSFTLSRNALASFTSEVAV
jgi:hypothetical protein